MKQPDATSNSTTATSPDGESRPRPPRVLLYRPQTPAEHWSQALDDATRVATAATKERAQAAVMLLAAGARESWPDAKRVNLVAAGPGQALAVADIDGVSVDADTDAAANFADNYGDAAEYLLAPYDGLAYLRASAQDGCWHISIKKALGVAPATQYTEAPIAGPQWQSGREPLGTTETESGTPAEATTDAARVLTRRDTGELSTQLCEMSTMIDNSPAYAHCDTETVLWRRCTKAVQEIGEVMEALAGVVGENPRKGVTHTMEDVEDELLDVAVSALGAVAHLHDNACDVGGLLSAHVHKIHARMKEATSGAAKAPTSARPGMVAATARGALSAYDALVTPHLSDTPPDGWYLIDNADADDVRTALEGAIEKLLSLQPRPARNPGSAA